MIRARDIHSLTEFRQNATAHLDRIAETRSAEVLTVNGKARGVVLAPEVFDELVEKAEKAEIETQISEGLRQSEAGEGRDFRAALCDISRQLGLAEPR